MVIPCWGQERCGFALQWVAAAQKMAQPVPYPAAMAPSPLRVRSTEVALTLRVRGKEIPLTLRVRATSLLGGGSSSFEDEQARLTTNRLEVGPGGKAFPGQHLFQIQAHGIFLDPHPGLFAC